MSSRKKCPNRNQKRPGRPTHTTHNNFMKMSTPPGVNMYPKSGTNGKIEWDYISNITESIIPNMSGMSDTNQKVEQLCESVEECKKLIKNMTFRSKEGSGVINDIISSSTNTRQKLKDLCETVERGSLISDDILILQAGIGAKSKRFISIDENGNAVIAQSNEDVLGVSDNSFIDINIEEELGLIETVKDYENRLTTMFITDSEEEEPITNIDTDSLNILISSMKEDLRINIIYKGVVEVSDDGLCIIGNKCNCADGVAVPAVCGQNGEWFVLSRVDEQNIRILLK